MCGDEAEEERWQDERLSVGEGALGGGVLGRCPLVVLAPAGMSGGRLVATLQVRMPIPEKRASGQDGELSALMQWVVQLMNEPGGPGRDLTLEFAPSLAKEGYVVYSRRSVSLSSARVPAYMCCGGEEDWVDECMCACARQNGL